MARPNTVAERLRAFVRARVRKDAPNYKWGNASRLAEHLQVDNGWVTEYTDTPPTSHADLDTALAICAFYRVTLQDFQSARPLPVATRPTAPTSKLAKQLAETVEGLFDDEMAVLLGAAQAVRDAHDRRIAAQSKPRRAADPPLTKRKIGGKR